MALIAVGWLLSAVLWVRAWRRRAPPHVKCEVVDEATFAAAAAGKKLERSKDLGAGGATGRYSERRFASACRLGGFDGWTWGSAARAPRMALATAPAIFAMVDLSRAPAALFEDDSRFGFDTAASQGSGAGGLDFALDSFELFQPEPSQGIEPLAAFLHDSAASGLDGLPQTSLHADSGWLV